MKKLLSFLFALSIITNINAQWNLTGNSGTTPPTNFLGTTDNQDLVFKRYGVISGRLMTDNVSLGLNSLVNLSSGQNNTAVGIYALYNNTSGSHNNANGYYALSTNTTGSNNSAIGSLALSANTTGSGNTGIGNYALSYNTTGGDNSAFGNQAMFSNTTGAENAGFGLRAMLGNTTGNYNVGFGSRALYTNSTGSNNTALGYYSMYYATGDYNTAIGSNSLNNTSTGEQNVAIGVNAGYYNSTGSNNVFVGFGTGYTITTGSENTIIGSNVTGLSNSLSNTIILADGAGTQRLYINSSGDAGFGTTSPAAKVDIQGGTVRIGNVTQPSGYKLYVEDGILTEKVKVAVYGGSHWSDFVFEDDYKLKPLHEVEAFIKKNKHLPGVPSAAEVVRDGIDLAKMDSKLLEKIEELTLYVIEMKKEIEQLKKENVQLKSSKK